MVGRLIFRGIDAAASLKRERVDIETRIVAIFRGIDAAASLKHVGATPRNRRLPHQDLPRHRCRGLIEACVLVDSVCRCRDAIFRGIDAAASLKPHSARLLAS